MRGGVEVFVALHVVRRAPGFSRLGVRGPDRQIIGRGAAGQRPVVDAAVPDAVIEYLLSTRGRAMPVDVDAMTRDEWRDLGFFYAQDDSAKTWKIIGSRAGIRGFAQLLRDYVAAPANRNFGRETYAPPPAAGLVSGSSSRTGPAARQRPEAAVDGRDPPQPGRWIIEVDDSHPRSNFSDAQPENPLGGERV